MRGHMHYLKAALTLCLSHMWCLEAHVCDIADMHAWLQMHKLCRHSNCIADVMHCTFCREEKAIANTRLPWHVTVLVTTATSRHSKLAM